MHIETNLYLQLFISVLLSALYFRKIKYEFFSIRGITIVYFTIFYPFTIFLVLVERLYYYDGLINNIDIIINTLYAYNIFIFIFYAVEFFRVNKYKLTQENHNLIINTNRVYLLLTFFMAALFLRLILGIYYHISINPEYNLSAGSFQNLIDKLHWIGIVSTFILFYKFHLTGRKFYLYISLFLMMFFIAIYLPSGSRTTAFSFVPIYLLYILISIKSLKKMILFTIISGTILALLVVFSGKLRVDESNFIDTGFQEDIAVLTNRLSDCLNTGRVIERVPSEYDYRYLDNIEALLYAPFPHFIRTKIGMKADFNDGPEYAYKIGLTPYWTSVPITILGDFYSRLGWFGVIFFSLILAYVLMFYDSILNKRSTVFKIIFLVLFSRYVSQIYVVDLQILFVTLTREFIVTYILSIGILYLIKKGRIIHVNNFEK